MTAFTVRVTRHDIEVLSSARIFREREAIRHPTSVLRTAAARNDLVDGFYLWRYETVVDASLRKLGAVTWLQLHRLSAAKNPGVSNMHEVGIRHLGLL